LALEPHFLKGLAERSKEGISQSRMQKMVPILTLVLAGLAVLLLLIIYAKSGVKVVGK